MRAIIPILILGICLAGCGGHPRSLVGVWETRADVGNGEMDFRDDCTFHSVRETALIKLVIDGTYEVKGENLRMHIVHWQLARGPHLSLNELDEMNKAFRSDSISTIKWMDDQHLQLSSADGQLTTAVLVTK